MGLSVVTINRGQGGLGRPLPGADHVSALVMLDEGWTVLDGAAGLVTTTNFKGLPIYGTDQAEALGIVEGGAVSAIAWRHISDFFTYAPGATLWLVAATETGVGVPTTGWETKVKKVIPQLFTMANGAVRQIALVTPAVALAQESALPAALTAELDLIEGTAPALVIVNSRFATETLTSVPDIVASDLERICMASAGAVETAGVITDSSTLIFGAPVGAILGMIAGAPVHVSIAWPERFDMTKTGHITPKHTTAEASGQVDKGYLELVKYTGLGGTYVAKSVTGAAATSDYSRIELVRTMDKAVRNVRTILLPKLNSPLYVDATGKLGEDTIAGFKALARQALESMDTAGEVSGFAVIIDPTQNVLSSSTLIVTIKIQPVGSAEEIVANIGYTLTL